MNNLTFSVNNKKQGGDSNMGSSQYNKNKNDKSNVDKNKNKNNCDKGNNKVK